MKKENLKLKSPYFTYRLCSEKSREFALSIRDFNENFITSHQKRSVIHPMLIHVYVKEAINHILFHPNLPVFRSTLKNTGHRLLFFKELLHNDEVETCATLEKIQKKKGKTVLIIKTRTRLIKSGDKVSEGIWEYESKQ